VELKIKGKIILKKDVLVLKDIRERRGAFFTPQIWVEKSQEYIAAVFGKNWQDNYYVWDCCAGTGNLLVGINRNIENVFASTIDESDVKAMYDRIDNGAQLLKKNVFQFDFLNDDFKKLPKVLREIIDDPKKRKKLIIYINPPYAEAGDTKQRTGTGKNKVGVSNTSVINNKYRGEIGKAVNEIFVQFIIRIYKEINGCKLCNFSTLKAINAENFVKFREVVNSKLVKLFLCPANTFDNVNGQFPIGFHIWNTGIKEIFQEIYADVFNKDGLLLGTKKIISYDNEKGYISQWIKPFEDNTKILIGMLNTGRSDFQNQRLVFISSHIVTKLDRKNRIYRGTLNIGANNLVNVCVYFAVRHCIQANWINNRDQFLYPKDKCKTDVEFQNNCLTYTFFHGQNKISSKHGVNHWIPFSEKELKIEKTFESHFMYNFIAGKIVIQNRYNLFDEERPSGKLEFSPEAKAVFEAGKELWKYYLGKPRVNVNASFYDIRLFFQGETNGRMNNKSDDEEYNDLLGNLREKMKILAKKIEPKVYKYGFLLK
jgi:16S rRNA G966 N2-methylase RsmD